ncbi:MFS general substrate transporter [Cutaneotrichosporon oleaginosum]|uniref:MFS general substrate transporter n=1 Tax=Cutaneotrichosporon oleaginosum TaxID=879819 RepID=A0A0J1B7N4_9TREE|nr:MFS general substrate transporter [Cutaneotrichosporon oleaginosum]KLT43769.1 MFS general substrate transporter [Cutaneotrichosporon oleaginosum]
MASERTPLLYRSGLSPARRRLLVATTMLTSFLAMLDLTIVATCVPTIASELGAFDREAWIGTAYLWSNVTFTPLYARLSDAIGRRTAYLQAVLLFTVGTLGCGLAPSFGALVVARFVAGMGGGGAGTVASIVLSETFVEDRGFYQGLGFAVFGAGIGLGGPIGGWLTQAWGWRAAFYAQVPVAILCIVLARLTIPQDSEKKYSAETLAEIDLGGSATLLLSIGSLLLLLQRSSADIPLRHDAVGLAALVASIGFFVAFIVVETRIAKRPVLPLSLLKQRTALCVGIIAGVIAIVNFNMLYHLPMVFEIVFGESLSQAGAHILPNSVAMTLSAPVMGILVKRTRRYKWLTVVCCAGPVAAMALLSTLGPGSSSAIRWLGVMPMGAGFSGLLTLTLIGMLNTVPKSQIAVATGFVFVFRSLGQVFGVGISGAVFQTSLAAELGRRFKDPELIDTLRHASEAIKRLPEPQRLLAIAAYGAALRNTFLFGLAGAVGVFVTSLFIPDRQLVDEEGKVPAGEGE